nr:jerky protein homolog [Crassostrea gigas]
MPRTYFAKKKKKNDSEDMKKAVDAVQKGEYSVRKAAEKYGVNKSTLHDTCKKKYKNPGKPGRAPLVPIEIENKIATALTEAARQGMGVSRRQLLRRVGALCKKMKVLLPSTAGNFPGKDWFEGFKKRHPELSIRKAEKLSTTRARMVNPQVVKNYFDDLDNILTRLDLHGKPSQIWNCDETGKQFEHDPVRVIAEKGSKSVVGRTSPGRTNITVMACVNAAGEKMSPLLIVKGKTPRSLFGFNTTAAPPGTKWHYQANGWMSDEIGDRWFQDIFLKECGDARPQLLILDGHSSHESLAILESAIQNDIHIISLPPHTTHALQPLDRSVFGPMNTAYNSACSDFLGQNHLNSVNKWSFPGLLAVAWETAVNSTNIRSGFRACGIYPFNPNAVSPLMMRPSKPSDIPLMSHDHSGLNEQLGSSATSDLTTTSNVISESSGFQTLPTNSAPLTTATAPITPLASDPPAIDDPDILLNLITSGDLAIFSPASNEIQLQPESASISVWDSAISEMFLPPIATSSSTKVKARQSSHRLLTSQDIVDQKQNLEQRKALKEMKKREKGMKTTKKLL